MPKTARRVEPPPRDVLERLIAAAPCNTSRAAITVAAWSGLREFEVAKLEYQDVIDTGSAWWRIRVRTGKGHKDRAAILLPAGVEAIRTLLPGPDDRGLRTPLFVRETGNQAGSQHNRHSLYKRFEIARRAVGADHIIFHDLRRFYATWLLNHDVADMDVAVALGHLDKNGQPDTTLVRKVYGFVNIDRALARAAEVAINGSSTGQVAGPADGSVAPRERDQVDAGDVEEGGEGGDAGPGGPGDRADAGDGDDEGVGVAGVDAEGGPGQGAQVVDEAFGVALEDARRALRAAARRSGVRLAREAA